MGFFGSKKTKPRSLLISKALQGNYKKDPDPFADRRYDGVPIADLEGKYDHIYMTYWNHKTNKPVKPMRIEFSRYVYDEHRNQYVFYSETTIDKVAQYFSGKALEEINHKIEDARKNLANRLAEYKWRRNNFLEGTVKEVMLAFKSGTKYTYEMIYRQIMLNDGNVLLLQANNPVKIGGTYRFYRWARNLFYDEVVEVTD